MNVLSFILEKAASVLLHLNKKQSADKTILTACILKYYKLLWFGLICQQLMKSH